MSKYFPDIWLDWDVMWQGEEVVRGAKTTYTTADSKDGSSIIDARQHESFFVKFFYRLRYKSAARQCRQMGGHLAMEYPNSNMSSVNYG